MTSSSLWPRLALVGLAALPLPTAALAQAQAPVAAALPGATRVDLVASGRVSRVPDLAIISAGVTTRAATAGEAIAANATAMERVRAALKRAGIENRDVRTSSISLEPQYRYRENQLPELVGYQAQNMLSIRFRDIARSGDILDVLVAQGANQLNGPTLTLDKAEQAEDEARVKAIEAGRARAELYARSLGKRVVRLVSVSEAGSTRPPMPMMERDAIVVTGSRVNKTDIVPGEQDIEVSLSMSFDLQ